VDLDGPVVGCMKRPSRELRDSIYMLKSLLWCTRQREADGELR